ncbi:Oidioi.mRNA.OKI2018_I69.chr1.g605.t1.cds [Oikopleura dioica]|uniref:Oidioi.mRNA.OKI2018_I69.chr1.g605.t1.cds n=1 Tax=Oikopleura dioica TaxID=34765 RepID=A0ABN7SKD8_OIKDI|nr:Oidioi.mRNA.OKI2018_I69.chr1.g605.t1.cds [Oikopleura dioica]
MRIYFLILISSLIITSEAQNGGFSVSNEARVIYNYAKSHQEFCGLAHCRDCLTLLRKESQIYGSEALQRQGYWTCTVIWLWNDCCPKWAETVVQML